MTSASAAFAEIALPVPIRRTWTYAVPETLVPRIGAGRRVRVPLGKRAAVGTVVGFPAPPPGEDVEVRDITAVLEGEPEPNAEILALTRFVSEYYLCSWGEAIEAALPPTPPAEPATRVARRGPGTASDGGLPPAASARRRVLARLPHDGSAVEVASWPAADRRALRELARAGIAIVEDVRAALDGPPSFAPVERAAALVPTQAQADVLAAISAAVASCTYAPLLLYGATGSGKTEVYLRSAEAALACGRGVLYLVPEIGLTPLLTTRLRARFGADVEVLHSGLDRRERARAWRRVARGECRFVLGTRSAVFSPVAMLGLVIVDEEHDGSYKQEDAPRYNGRDLAIFRAREAGATAVLGSATPSMESFQHARAGRYGMLRLGGRVESRPLPDVEIVDMRREFERVGGIRPVSAALRNALAGALERGEQALVLRNRRGWAAAVFCPRCGNRLHCARCAVALTWHRAERRLRCHACGWSRREAKVCPHCGHADLKHLGEGSERIEAELRELFPQAIIRRMDRDTVRSRGAHEALLRAFDRREIDLLVGTQMIAKGHDFPGVTVVGVLAADHALGLPDFRAGERTFQLLTQVAGRAGRGDRPGRVMLQAFDPGHAVLRDAAVQDFERFFEREIAYRRAMRYPPFAAVVNVVVSDRDAGRAAEWSERIASAVREAGGGRLLVAGPAPAPVERLRGRYRWQVLARSAGRRQLHSAIAAALTAVETEVPRRAVHVDVDPYSLL